MRAMGNCHLNVLNKQVLVKNVIMADSRWYCY